VGSVVTGDIGRRIARWDWAHLEEQLEVRGHALPGRLLAARECTALRRLFDDDARFRSTIDMAPRRYGDGCYRYFANPLPEPVAQLRSQLYEPLAEIANRWWERLGREDRFEPTLDEFLDRCHRGGQERPTPLLLRYGPGGYNRLHQDVYGAVAFPFQVVVQLTDPERDFTGGDFLLTEQRARMQSRGWSVRLGRGEALIFPNALRPVRSPRGDSRATVRHGVSDVLSGGRVTLGIIFHDAA
jgi:hypothetical protein